MAENDKKRQGVENQAVQTGEMETQNMQDLRAEDTAMLERIRQEAEQEPVPEALKPEKIAQLLTEKKKENRFRVLKKYIPAAAAAACICLVAGISAAVGLVGLTGGDSTGSGADMASGSGAVSGSGRESSSALGTADTAESGLPEENRLVCARDYDEIYSSLQNAPTWSADGIMEGAGAFSDGESAMNSGVTESATDKGASESFYSDTNTREEDVEEGDVVKTDGKNLYILNGMTVEIVGIESGILEEKAEIVLDEDAYMAELYVSDDRLLVVYTEGVYSATETKDFFGYFRENTCSAVYDVSDPASPELLGSISQSGSYNTMRVNGEYVYVLSSYYVDSGVNRFEVDSYVPEVQGETMAAEDIYMPQENAGDQYTVITAFSLNNPGEKTDSRAVFGSAGICYVSGDSIYVTEEYYGSGAGDTNQTCIRKVSYKDGKLEGIAQTRVDGALKDSFCIDEHDGNLRLVTTETRIRTVVTGENTGDGTDGEEDAAQTEVIETENTESNSLYILDENLQLLSEIGDIAQGERVYSARFMGDTGYFVTFRQMDPLFSVDLSDPENPEIIGELKIPGFSEYLHPYGDGLLLGIGMDTDDEGVTTTGVKLSMFDISDPSDVKEKDTLVLEGMYSTDVSYNYKAAFVDAERGLFGFLAYGEWNAYYIYTWDETGGFRKVFERDCGNGGVRGLYVGDVFYLTSGNTVESYEMSGYTKIDDIVL